MTRPLLREELVKAVLDTVTDLPYAGTFLVDLPGYEELISTARGGPKQWTVTVLLPQPNPLKDIAISVRVP